MIRKQLFLSCCLDILRYDNPAHTRVWTFQKASEFRIPGASFCFAYPGAPFKIMAETWALNKLNIDICYPALSHRLWPGMESCPSPGLTHPLTPPLFLGSVTNLVTVLPSCGCIETAQSKWPQGFHFPKVGSWMLRDLLPTLCGCLACASSFSRSSSAHLHSVHSYRAPDTHVEILASVNFLWDIFLFFSTTTSFM